MEKFKKLFTPTGLFIFLFGVAFGFITSFAIHSDTKDIAFFTDPIDNSLSASAFQSDYIQYFLKKYKDPELEKENAVSKYLQGSRESISLKEQSSQKKSEVILPRINTKESAVTISKSNPTEVGQGKFCVDSDQSFNPFVKGSVLWGDTERNFEQTYDDKSFKNGIIEYYCDGNNVRARYIDCDLGMKDGACLSSESSIANMMNESTEPQPQGSFLVKHASIQPEMTGPSVALHEFYRFSVISKKDDVAALPTIKFDFEAFGLRRNNGQSFGSQDFKVYVVEQGVPQPSVSYPVEVVGTSSDAEIVITFNQETLNPGEEVTYAVFVSNTQQVNTPDDDGYGMTIQSGNYQILTPQQYILSHVTPMAGSLSVSLGNVVPMDILLPEQQRREILNIRLQSGAEDVLVSDIFLENDVNGDESPDNIEIGQRLEFGLYNPAGILLQQRQMQDGKLHFELPDPLLLPAGGIPVIVSIKVNVYPINTASQTGKRLRLSIDSNHPSKGINALFTQNGGYITPPSGGWGDAISEEFVVYKSEMILDHAQEQPVMNLPSVALAEAYRFTVTAAQEGPVQLGRISLDTSFLNIKKNNGVFNSDDFKLVPVEQGITNPDQMVANIFVSQSTHSNAVVQCDFMDYNQILSSGETKTYALFVKNTEYNGLPENSGMAVSFYRGTWDTTYKSPNIAFSTDTSTAWSDVSAENHSLMTNDWMNGYLLEIDQSEQIMFHGGGFINGDFGVRHGSVQPYFNLPSVAPVEVYKFDVQAMDGPSLLDEVSFQFGLSGLRHTNGGIFTTADFRVYPIMNNAITYSDPQSVQVENATNTGVVLKVGFDDEWLDTGEMKRYAVFMGNTEELGIPLEEDNLSILIESSNNYQVLTPETLIHKREQVSIDCEDSDGKNYSKKGLINSNEYSQVEDYCVDTKQLTEYYCDGNIGKKELHSCGEGFACERGMCVSSCPTIKCETPPSHCYYESAILANGCKNPCAKIICQQETTQKVEGNDSSSVNEKKPVVDEENQKNLDIKN